MSKFVLDHSNISVQKVHVQAHTAGFSLNPQDCSEACSFDPPLAGNSSWCCIPMAHTWLWALQPFPSCCVPGMGSAGTCLWQASAFTLTLVSCDWLPSSQVTNANTHCLRHRLQKCRHTDCARNRQNQEPLKSDPNHLKSICTIVRADLASHVSLSDSKTCLDSGCGLEL